MRFTVHGRVIGVKRRVPVGSAGLSKFSGVDNGWSPAEMSTNRRADRSAAKFIVSPVGIMGTVTAHRTRHPVHASVPSHDEVSMERRHK